MNLKILQTFFFHSVIVPLQNVKLYLTTFSEMESKMCCITINLTLNPFTLNKYCIYKLLYMIVTRSQNKTLHNFLLFSVRNLRF